MLSTRIPRFLVVSMALCLSFMSSTLTAADKKTSGDSTPDNYVHQYLKKLKVEDLALFSMVHKFKHLDVDGDDADKVRAQIEAEFFSELSGPTIARIFRSFSLPEYPNVFVTGEAGVGKTFLIDQLVMLFSFGVVPDFLKEELNLTGEGTMADQIAEAFLGNYEIVLLDNNLLSHSMDGNGAYASEEVRMKTTLLGLFAAAKKEYTRSDKKGKRTLFVINEAGLLPPFIHEALKSILDEGGFLASADASMRRQDPGYHVLAMTTPPEYFRLVQGDSAIERRYVRIEQREPSDAETFDVIRGAADGIWKTQYPQLTVEDEALRYLVHMKSFLSWPPLAAPASPKAALNQLIAWKMHHPNDDPNRVTLKDAQRFLMGRAGLTDIWFEGPNGEPPFHNFAERVKKLVVGHDTIIERIAAGIQAWVRTGMSKDVPVFFLGGPTGSGKDTIVAAFNMVLFGHDGKELMFNIGGREGFAIDAIFDGPPLGNHSDGRPSLAVEALQKTRGTGLLTLNEGADTDKRELDKLKVLIERGAIHPSGVDSRPRPIRYPVFILGQWGEDFFDSDKYKDNSKTYEQLTQIDIDNFFLEGGHGKGSQLGAVSQALLDRAKKTGGVYLLEPTPQDRYSEIVEVWLPGFIKSFLDTNDYQVEVLEELIKAIAKHAVDTGHKARGLYAIAVDFTRGAISKAIDQGLPERHAKITLGYNAESSSVIVKHEDSTPKTYEIKIADVARTQTGDCEKTFLD